MVNENMKRPCKFPSSRKKTKKTSYHNDSPMKPAKIKYTLTVTFVMLWVTGTCIELPVERQSANLPEMSWQDARKQKWAQSDPEIPLLETGGIRDVNKNGCTETAPEVSQIIAKHCKQPQYLYLLTSSFGHKQHKTRPASLRLSGGIYWKDTLLHFLEMKEESNHQCSKRKN